MDEALQRIVRFVLLQKSVAREKNEEIQEDLYSSLERLFGWRFWLYTETLRHLSSIDLCQ